MATGTAVVVGATLAAAAAGAVVVLLVSGAPAPPPASPAGDGELAALQRRLDRQEEEIGALRDRLDEALSARPPSPLPPRGGTPLPGDPGAPPLPGNPGPEGTEGVPHEEFEARFREMREKEQEEARRTRAVEEEAALRSRLDRNKELALTEEQKDGLVRLLMDRGRRLREVFEEARRLGTPDDLRIAQEKAAGIRAETRTALEGLLTAEQMKVLEGADGGGRAGRFGGRAGGGEGGGRREGGRRLPGGGGAPR